jgi:hypothetical protein
MVEEWRGAVGYPSSHAIAGRTAEKAFCFEPCATPRHIKVRAMSSWLVPPIVIPVLIVILVVVYGLYRAYS